MALSRRAALRPTYANVVATLALLIAVVGFAGGPQAVASAVKKLAPNSVATKNIKNNAVTGVKVKDGSLGGADIKDGSLGGADIANGSLGGVDIADRSLGGQDIAAGSLGGYNLAAGTIGSREIADGSISSADISNGTITDHDLAPGAITSANIGPETIQYTNIAPETIRFGNLDPGAITDLTHLWDGKPISPTSTVTGYASIAYVAGQDPAHGATQAGPESRGLSVSFPAPVAGLAASDAVKAGGSPQCTGDFDDPTAAPGYICYYVGPDGSSNGSDNHVGTFSPLDYTGHGFTLMYHAPVQDWTFARITWAFTRPGP